MNFTHFRLHETAVTMHPSISYSDYFFIFYNKDMNLTLYLLFLMLLAQHLNKKQNEKKHWGLVLSAGIDMLMHDNMQAC